MIEKYGKGVPVPEDEFFLATDIAKTITSKYNQQTSLLLLGPRGSGKSWAAIRLAYDISVEVARIKGGVPNDYFTFEHIAIITKDEILRVMKTKLGQYNIVILDDAGTGLNSRNFMTKFSKIMNNIYQTFRTRNCALILTTPDASLIDTVPRHLVEFYCNVEESHFDYGFVEIKVKRSVRDTQNLKNKYPFVRVNNTRFPRHIINTAPKFLTDQYEIARTKIEKEESDKSLQELADMDADGDSPKKGKIKQSEMLRPAICALAEQHFSQKEIAKMVGVSQPTVSNILSG